MKTIQFKVTLLSDIVIQQTSGTSGTTHTLDFIPGACFMGIAASSTYKEKGMCDETFSIFHSGKVRFGDAHPALGDHRTSRVPLDFYHPKFDEVEDKCYIHHCISDFSQISLLQLKQCRSGYYDFVNPTCAQAVKVEKSIALKSARDPQSRRSLDSSMFCYESIDKGLSYYFEVEIEDESLVETITSSLIGTRHIGRSRSAQYGLVKIEPTTFTQPACQPQNESAGEVAIYADSRLIFLDEYGLPTYQPSAKDLGFEEDATIDWSRSQVRSFSYTPWNYQRQCFDTERCGIEKGSVIIVKTKSPKSGAMCVGEYRTEGFGHILINPCFLQPQPNQNGLAQVKLKKATVATSNAVPFDSALIQTPLLRYLRRQTEAEQLESSTFESINSWIKAHGSAFTAPQFASQWGTIRSLAMEGGKASEIRNRIADYVSHGVASKRWQKFQRSKDLLSFIDSIGNDAVLQSSIINLASEMAKKSKKGGTQK